MRYKNLDIEIIELEDKVVAIVPELGTISSSLIDRDEALEVIFKTIDRYMGDVSETTPETNEESED